jgi:hypothetical protein
MTNISAMNEFGILYNCGYPQPRNSDVEAWNSLDFGSGATAVLQFGLFGYDMTCFYDTCAAALDEDIQCATFASLGIDGLSFGLHAEIDETESADNYYCIGFRDTEFGDHAVCLFTSSNYNFYYGWLEGYTVTGDWFDSDLSGVVAYATNMLHRKKQIVVDSFASGTVRHWNGFRFVGGDENDGYRWVSGDSIDLFALDFKAEVLTDNEGFVLASAAHLTAVGATLVAAIMLM